MDSRITVRINEINAHCVEEKKTDIIFFKINIKTDYLKYILLNLFIKFLKSLPKVK